jgi:hypothetical protein
MVAVAKTKDINTWGSIKPLSRAVEEVEKPTEAQVGSIVKN